MRNGGGPRSFLPSGIYDNTSDTEPDTEDEDLTKPFTSNEKMVEDDRPVETVFGHGVVVTRSFGGRLHAKVQEDPKQYSHVTV